jgi:hypothetical protein
MRTLNDIYLHGEIADVSTADQCWIPIPDDGHVQSVYATLDVAITVADATLTFEIGGTAIGDSLTIAFTGSAAGSTFALENLSPDTLNRVSKGGALEVITDGGSTTASRLYVTVVIRR